MKTIYSFFYLSVLGFLLACGTETTSTPDTDFKPLRNHLALFYRDHLQKFLAYTERSQENSSIDSLFYHWHFLEGSAYPQINDFKVQIAFWPSRPNLIEQQILNQRDPFLEDSLTPAAAKGLFAFEFLSLLNSEADSTFLFESKIENNEIKTYTNKLIQKFQHHLYLQDSSWQRNQIAFIDLLDPYSSNEDVFKGLFSQATSAIDFLQNTQLPALFDSTQIAKGSNSRLKSIVFSSTLLGLQEFLNNGAEESILGFASQQQKEIKKKTNSLFTILLDTKTNNTEKSEALIELKKIIQIELPSLFNTSVTFTDSDGD